MDQGGLEHQRLTDLRIGHHFEQLRIIVPYRLIASAARQAFSVFTQYTHILIIGQAAESHDVLKQLQHIIVLERGAPALRCIERPGRRHRAEGLVGGGEEAFKFRPYSAGFEQFGLGQFAVRPPRRDQAQRGRDTACHRQDRARVRNQRRASGEKQARCVLPHQIARAAPPRARGTRSGCARRSWSGKRRRQGERPLGHLIDLLDTLGRVGVGLALRRDKHLAKPLFRLAQAFGTRQLRRIG